MKRLNSKESFESGMKNRRIKAIKKKGKEICLACVSECGFF